jgi:hypothetical protein
MSALTETELRTRLEHAEARLATVPALVQLLHRYYKAVVLEHEQGRPLEENTYLLLLQDSRDALAAWQAKQ